MSLARVGRVSLLQATVLAIVETVVHSANQALVLADGALAVCDVGGTVGVHLFGAYFGLAVARARRRAAPPPPDAARRRPRRAAGLARVGLFALLGTLVMWVYWPALSARSLGGGSHQAARAVVAGCSRSAVDGRRVRALVRGVGERGGPAPAAGRRAQPTLRAASRSARSRTGRSRPRAARRRPAAGAARRLVRGVRDALRAAGVADACDVHSLHGLPALVGVAASAIAAGSTKGPSRARRDAAGYQCTARPRRRRLVGGLFTGGVRLLAARARGGGAAHTGSPGLQGGATRAARI